MILILYRLGEPENRANDEVTLCIITLRLCVKNLNRC